jgi:hypothetical protein
MPIKQTPGKKEPDWTAEKTIRVLRQQLAELEKVKTLAPLDAYKEKEGWTQVTRAAITHGFGEQSQTLFNFNFAHYKAIHKDELKDFRAVTEAHETVLNSAIRELEFMLPGAELKSAYDSGDEFAFYLDLKGILASATVDIFIVDAYLNRDFFELYVATVKTGVILRIMTDQLRGNLGAVAQKYANNQTLELRSSPDVHDRHIFIDQRGWIVGQSIKDAAKKNPPIWLNSVLVWFQLCGRFMKSFGTKRWWWLRVSLSGRKSYSLKPEDLRCHQRHPPGALTYCCGWPNIATL